MKVKWSKSTNPTFAVNLLLKDLFERCSFMTDKSALCSVITVNDFPER